MIEEVIRILSLRPFEYPFISLNGFVMINAIGIFLAFCIVLFWDIDK